MNLLKHMLLLPGRGLVLRHAPDAKFGRMCREPESHHAGEKVHFNRAEATFQQGKRHYAVVLVSQLFYD